MTLLEQELHGFMVRTRGRMTTPYRSGASVDPRKLWQTVQVVVSNVEAGVQEHNRECLVY
ncbi:hypothetical protein BM1_00969 [Bipolaris maydis]|nr:hypothetical protein BM1_00969 [Bipolaris maydis]